MTYCTSESFCDALQNLPPMFKLSKWFSQTAQASSSNGSHFITFLLQVKSHLKLNTPTNNLVKCQNDLYNKETYMDFYSNYSISMPCWSSHTLSRVKIRCLLISTSTSRSYYCHAQALAKTYACFPGRHYYNMKCTFQVNLLHLHKELSTFWSHWG